VAATPFEDDETGYRSWTDSHPDGFVLNIRREFYASDARAHRANCRTISGEPPHGDAWTGPYVKVCALSLAEIDDWANAKADEPISRRKVCEPQDTSGLEDQPNTERWPRGSQSPRAPIPADAPRECHA
jgi:hypothetical protein